MRRWFAVVSLGVVAVLVAGGLTVGARPAPAVADDGSAPPVADAQWADSDADAASIAAQYGHAVGVTGESSPTSEVSALPDGEMQLVEDSVPQRVLDNGAWHPVDTTLATATNGFLAPAVSAAPVQFSDGGSDVMARIQGADGSWAEQTWPGGSLPTPTVSGSTASYASVLPGVDLILSATPSGMSEVFEVHTAAAAANPQLQALELGVQGATLSQDAVDSTVATFPTGSTIQAEEPLWWDSSAPGSGPAGPAGAEEPQPVQHTVTAAAESLDVQAVADDTDAVYPVFVDPAWSSQDNDHWYDDAAYPNQSYLNGNENSSWLATGHAVQDGVSYTSRAFWQFPTGPLEGKTITAAHLTVNETETFDTSDTVGLYLIETPRLTDGATWNQENATANVWAHLQTTFTPASSGNTLDVKNAVTWGVGASDSGLQFGLKASDESSASSRKHWNLRATLAVMYDTKPGQPTSPQVKTPARACGTSAAPSYVNSKVQKIVLQAKTSDPDSGDTVNTTFNVSGTGTASATSGLSAPGTQTGILNANALSKDGAYTWTAVSKDKAGVTGPTSGTCYLYVDNTPPPWPTIKDPPAGTTIQVGTPLTLTVTYAAADNVDELEYWWGGTVANPVTSSAPSAASYAGTALPSCNTTQGNYTFVCVSTTTSTSLTVTPPDITSVLWVAALDKAGNVSASANGTTKGFWPAVSEQGIIQQNPAAAHDWMTSTASTTSTTVADTSTAATPQPIALGAGLGMASPPPDPQFGSAAPTAALSLPGLAMLQRVTNGTVRATEPEGAMPTGYQHDVDLGMISPPDQQAPDQTAPLYGCVLSDGNNMTTTDSDCEGADEAASPTPLGSIWTDAASVPGGATAVALYRCLSGSAYFDSTAADCEGGTLSTTLGYLAELGVDQTASSVITTAKSFSVAAWVYPDQDGGGSRDHVIISGSGSTGPAFSLQEAAGGNSDANTEGPLEFCLADPSGTGTPTCTDVSDAPPIAKDQWTFVVGIWNAPADKLSLYVGFSADATPYTAQYTGTPASANGPVVIGSAVASGSVVDQWDGLIMNPMVFQGVLDSDQRGFLYGFNALVPAS